MDGNMYNYTTGNLWNGYTEGFQPPPLDLQNYMQTSREHFPREQNKNPLVPAPSPYVFLNYPEEAQHHYHHPHDSRNQWHFPTWPKIKGRPDTVLQGPPKRHMDKQFNRDGETGMSMAHPGPSHLSVPPPGGFCTPDITERVMDDIQRLSYPMDQNQEQMNPIISAPPVSAPTQPVVNQVGNARRNTARKNPAPRKRKEKSKSADNSAKKRTRDEEKWARNVRKKARNKGESYISVQGKIVPARAVKPVDCSRCKFNCPLRVSEEERQNLFKEYWNLENFKDKVDYIAGCVYEFKPLRPVSGRRAYSRRYMLRVNGKDERVCKEFFVSTFDISESTIVTYMDKKRKGPGAIADMRGKQTPSNKTPDTVVRSIREHILSQTGLQGVLTRSPSDDVKNVKKLYRNYQTECELDNIKPASISVYRKVYSDMHKDKSDVPVELPPESILFQNPTKKSKTDKDESHANASEVEEDDTGHLDAPPSPDSDSATEPLLPVSSLQPTSTLANTLRETASPFDLGLVPNPYQNSIQNVMTEPVVDKQMTGLDIPHTLPHQHHHNQQQLHLQQPQQHTRKTMHNSSFQDEPMVASHDRGHINILPFMWDSNRMGNNSINNDHNLGYCSASFPNQNNLVQPSSTALSSSLFNYRISSSSTTHFPSHPSTSGQEIDPKPYQVPFHGAPVVKVSGAKKSNSGGRGKKPKEKGKKEPKKRIRNEESWGRNVRKRLRFKGEAYTSVRGKLVEAKLVRKVDCSKCKFKCTSRITDEQREELNKVYWSLDTYKKKIEYLTKYVETYTPKRKMTGRRAYSRKYLLEVDGCEERVCKDFFKATLHISESTIATALEKVRKGPEAIVDMRGKHKPVNKTTEETLQSIRELIIYLTGMRPHRSSNNNRLGSEYRDVNRLYQVYKYDCEKKGKKLASLGIFRNVLVKEFCIKTAKLKKGEKEENFQSKDKASLPAIAQEKSQLLIPQFGLGKNTPALNQLLPSSETEPPISQTPQYPDLGISALLPH